MSRLSPFPCLEILFNLKNITVTYGSTNVSVRHKLHHNLNNAVSFEDTKSLASSRMSRRTMLTLTFGLVTCEQKGEIGGEGHGRGGGGDKVGVKGPGIRRALLFRRLVQPPRYAISAEARGVYRRRGRAQRRTRRGWWVKDGRREGGRMGGRGLVRQGSRVDAWAWVRPQERDGDRDCREGTGGREGAAVERRGEDRSVGEREARGLDGLDSPARRY